MFAIVGGVSGNWSLILEGGFEMEDNDLPKLPAAVNYFGLTQAYDRLIFLCGGRIGSKFACCICML